MMSRISQKVTWMALFLLALIGLSSCQKRFSILEYQFTVVSVTPGYWQNGEMVRYPSVEVRVDGPDAQEWDITVSPENGAQPYVESTVTGKQRSIVLEGIQLSAERREMGLTIQATHVNTGEVLATTRQYKATLEGDFTPPVPPETIFVTSLSMVVGEESSSVTVTDGHSATIDAMEGYSGTLIISYRQDATETDPITCTIAQTAGDSHITLSQEGIIREDSHFIIPFTALEPGSGSFSVILKGKGQETVLAISYVVKSRPYEATFEPNHFTFAELYDAHGTVSIFGFQDGEKCDVVLHWIESTTGEEGSTSYKGVDAKEPLDVILWKAGETKIGYSYVFWADVYEEGEANPVVTSEERTVSPLAISFAWTDAKGKPIAADDAVRSYTSSDVCKLDVVTASWTTEFINIVTVEDKTAERTYTSQDPLTGDEADYVFEMKHPKRGVHTFSITLETVEGNYTFENEMKFIDVWTVSPYAKGASLYINFTGPASSIKTDCNMNITLYGYAIWDYTVAETNAEGQKVNTPKQEKKFIGQRTEPFTIEKGTSKGSDIKVKPIAGLFNVAMRMLKDKCSGKPFSMTGITATRWDGDKVVSYTPATSNTFVRFDITADAAFYNDYNELETNISKLKSTLNQNGIYY